MRKLYPSQFPEGWAQSINACLSQKTVHTGVVVQEKECRSAMACAFATAGARNPHSSDGSFLGRYRTSSTSRASLLGRWLRLRIQHLM